MHLNISPFLSFNFVIQTKITINNEIITKIDINKFSEKLE